MYFETGVVIPTFNRAKLLEQTLASVLSHSHAPAQVVVVDDGSTDDTEVVVKSYGSPVHYHRIDNSGQAHARNVGVSLLTTPWLAFCDDDDLWRPEYLSECARLFSAEQEIEYAFCNFVHVRDGTWEAMTKFDTAPQGFWDVAKRDSGMSAWVLEEPLYARIVKFQPIFPSAVILNRDFFDRIGRFDESFSRTVGEDLEFTLRCVQETPIGCLREPLVGIRKHGSNFSGDELENLLGSIAIFQHALRYHNCAKDCCDTIENEISVLRKAAADLAFGERKLDIVRQLCNSIPRQDMPAKLALKHFVSHLPEPLAHVVNSSLLAISNVLRVSRHQNQ